MDSSFTICWFSQFACQGSLFLQCKPKHLDIPQSRWWGGGGITFVVMTTIYFYVDGMEFVIIFINLLAWFGWIVTFLFLIRLFLVWKTTVCYPNLPPGVCWILNTASHLEVKQNVWNVGEFLIKLCKHTLCWYQCYSQLTNSQDFFNLSWKVWEKKKH